MKPLTSANDQVSSDLGYALAWLSVVMAAVFSIMGAIMAISSLSWVVVLAAAIMFEWLPIIWFILALRYCRKMHRWVWFDQITGKFQIGRKGQQAPFLVSGPPIIEGWGNHRSVRLKSIEGVEINFLPTNEFYRNLKNGRYPVLRQGAGLQSGPTHSL